MGGKRARFAQTWDLIKQREFIMTGFILIFRDNLCETRLTTTLRPCPFKGSPGTNKVFKEILQTELEEGIIEITTRELVKCWNPTFIVPKPDGGWRKILDATQLNDEILPLHFQMQGVENVKMIIQPIDWLTKLDLKSSFHHLTVYEPHRPYLAFEVEGKDMGFTNNQLLGRYSPITPGLNDLEATNNPFDGNIRTVWSNNLAQEVRTGTETGVGILRMDLELGNNGIIYAGRSKIDELGFTQEISKDNFGQSYDQSKISGSDNWNFKFSQNTVQGGFPLSDALMLSTDTSSERAEMVRDDETTDVSTARDRLQLRMQPPWLGSDSGTENGRSSSSMGSLEKGGNKMDKQQVGNGGHFLRTSVFRNTLCTIGNEGDSDKIGQLFDSIQSQKTEGSTTTSIWAQESIQDNPTFRSLGIISTRFRSDQLHCRFSEQIGQLGRLQYKPTIGANPIPLVESRANSGFSRKPIQCDSTSLCINRPEGLKCTMDRSIQPYMGERNPLDPPTYPNDTLDFNDTQTVMNYSDCG
ncbi:MAG: hypothetical protein EZS28_040199, partial [Streblomastix strix]